MGTQSGRPKPDGGVIRRPLLGIIGAGRVGGALVRSLPAYESAVYSRTPDAAEHLASTSSGLAVATLADLAKRSDLIIIATPDDAIAETARALAAFDLTDKAVIHTSGATGLDALLPARQARALTGGLHPIMNIVAGARLPAGVTYGLEADREPLRGWLHGIITALDGIPLWLRAGTDRARYHASAIFASNYLVTIFNEGLSLLSRYAVDEETAKGALLAISRATLDGIEQLGPVKAINGPVVRGDGGTVARQYESLAKLDPELGELYRQLARRTLRLAAARGLEPAKLDALQEFLDHANDHS